MKNSVFNLYLSLKNREDVKRKEFLIENESENISSVSNEISPRDKIYHEKTNAKTNNNLYE